MESVDFEKIYNDILIEHGYDSKNIINKAIFDAGRAVSFEQNLIDAYKSKELIMKAMSVTAGIMANHAVKINAEELSISMEVNIDGSTYFTRLSSVTFEAEEKTLEERAGEIARNIMNSTVVSDYEELLKKAVLAGYNLRRDDFKEE